MAILSVNAGSSSLKFALHPVVDGAVVAHILFGCIERLEPGGQPELRWTWAGKNHFSRLPTVAGDPFDAALSVLRETLLGLPGLPPIQAVSHRVVHGGLWFQAPVRATPDVLQQLEQLNPLAPLHQPHNLAGVRAFSRSFPEAAQVLCFDTAFHATMDPLATTFGLPTALTAQGVRRYGFHGLSYSFILHQLQLSSSRAGGRLLLAHLGNGASVCAVRDGQSVATSMGFSALDGLMMGTRSGALDAGVLLYLLEQGWDHDRLQNLLYRESGLLGTSGISADMRTLRTDHSEQARFAVDLFEYRLLRESGAMIACLEGLDVIAFSGGIGEHDAVLRKHLTQHLGWLGVALDDTLNRLAIGDAVVPIHAPGSSIEIWVVPTDEGFVAARGAWDLLQATTCAPAST